MERGKPSESASATSEIILQASDLTENAPESALIAKRLEECLGVKASLVL